MDQLTQQLKSGAVAVRCLPWPQVGAGMVLVRNHFSLISAGTEGSTVRTARKSLLGKAKERPQQVRQVLDVLKKQGPVQTYRAVMKKLDSYSSMGYSSAGRVLEVGRAVVGFAPDDPVACAGIGYASHAEIVCVPVNLCVKLPPEADLKRASYNTLGAIALQGIRQADLRLGESCAVIGLGLLGQLTCLMLRAAGVRTYGIDVQGFAVELAKEHCCDDAWVRDEPGVAEYLDALTDGLGVDAVLITAATDSLDPVNFAGQIARKKGRVVVVGAVPTGFDREAYYRKELELRMSCSYGPGRYDPDYEEKGIDYPAAYVRWTEKRNMRAFQELAHSGRIDLGYLTTHEFPLEQAPQAYDMIVTRSEPFLGIVLKYDVDKPLARARVEVRPGRAETRINIAFVGAGSYAQQHLLPNIPQNDKDVACVGVMTSSGTTSKRVGEKFGFQFCTAQAEDVFENGAVNTVFIVTRHNSHAHYVQRALAAGKHVFVEKPLCLTVAELGEIEELYGSGSNGCQLMIGFNRRFAPQAVELKRHLGAAPVSMLYRINAGAIPREHWIQDPQVGGGRILGEACHFVDFLTWLCGALPRRVHALALPDPHGLNDTVSVNLEFANGSIGTICYFANGSKELPKEYVEVYRAGLTGIIRDFRELEIYATGRPHRRRSLVQDKGQAGMVRAFLQSIKDGGASLIPAAEIFAVTRAAFGVLESLRTRRAVSL